MKPLRFTIAQWMGFTAVLALNAALVQAFVVQQMFIGVILIFIAVQLGLGCLLHSGGTLRRFWLGFEVFGVAAIIAMFACELFPKSALNRLLMSYVDFATNLAFSHLPTPLEDHFDQNQDQLLAVVYFVPELVAALFGGIIVRCLDRSGRCPCVQTRSTLARDRFKVQRIRQSRSVQASRVPVASGSHSDGRPALR